MTKHQESVYRTQIEGMRRDIETLKDNIETLNVENLALQDLVEKLKEDTKTITYKNDPKAMIQELEIENNELRKEIEVMKSILQRLEKDLLNAQDKKTSIENLKRENRDLREELEEKDEMLEKVKLEKLALEDKRDNTPFAKDMLSLVLKNINISEQIRNDINSTKTLNKDLE